MMDCDVLNPRDSRLLWVLENELDDTLFVAFARMRLFEELDYITFLRKAKETDDGL